MFNAAFIPQGNTSLIKATTTASAAIQSTGSGGVQGFAVFAASTALCLIAMGPSTATAALPTTSTPASGVPIPGNTMVKFQAPPSYWVSAIMSTAGGAADVYITPGQGQ